MCAALSAKTFNVSTLQSGTLSYNWRVPCKPICISARTFKTEQLMFTSCQPSLGYHMPVIKFSSVTQYSIYVSRSLIIKIMTAVLMRSSYVETFQFSAGQRTIRL